MPLVTRLTVVNERVFSMRVPVKKGGCEFEFWLLGQVRSGDDAGEGVAAVSGDWVAAGGEIYEDRGAGSDLFGIDLGWGEVASG
jgi:hypothetical protein